MRKSIVSFVLGSLVMIIPPVFAIEEMSADVMKKTTGQASVSVQVDNVVIEDLRISMLYIDDDGISGSPEDAAGIRIKYTQGIRTYRAIFDYTDRGGYLEREYGTLMRREALNGAEGHWTGLAISTGGEVKPTPLTLTTYKKLPLHSYMKAFNSRGKGLDEAKDAYKMLSSLGFDFSSDETTNIEAVMDATGMTRNAAVAAYSAASGYASISSSADADRLGTEMALRNINVSGIGITLPTLEISTDINTTSYTAVAEGAVNNGAEYASITKTGNTMAILSGNVEICKSQ